MKGIVDSGALSISRPRDFEDTARSVISMKFNIRIHAYIQGNQTDRISQII